MTAHADTIPGGTPEDNEIVARAVLGGEAGPARDIVVLNAGAGLYVAGRADSIAAGVEQATASIDSGAAAAKLDALVARTS